jgi:hypothetical protein
MAIHCPANHHPTGVVIEPQLSYRPPAADRGQQHGNGQQSGRQTQQPGTKDERHQGAGGARRGRRIAAAEAAGDQTGQVVDFVSQRSH